MTNSAFPSRKAGHSSNPARLASLHAHAANVETVIVSFCVVFATSLGCAMALILLAFAASYVLFGPEPRFPYLLFFPAVIIAAAILGRGSGIFAALSSAALALCYFVPQVGSLSVADPIDALGGALYLAVAVLIAWIVEALHVAYGAVVEALAESEAARIQAETDLRERDLLLAERDHRVKNDMQRLVGLLT